jgi:hypothetical protein
MMISAASGLSGLGSQMKPAKSAPVGTSRPV